MKLPLSSGKIPLLLVGILVLVQSAAIGAQSRTSLGEKVGTIFQAIRGSGDFRKSVPMVATKAALDLDSKAAAGDESCLPSGQTIQEKAPGDSKTGAGPVTSPAPVVTQDPQMGGTEIESMKAELKRLSDEVAVLKNAKQKDEQQKKDVQEKDMILERRQAKAFESVKNPITFSGDLTFNFQNSRVADNKGGKGSSNSDYKILRLAGLIPVAEKAYGTYRLMMVQPTRRNSDSNTNFMIDILTLDKGNMFKGDWRVGRQYVYLGNGVVLMNFCDGISYTYQFHPKLSGRALYVNESIDPSTGKTHGLDATVLNFEYQFNASHSLGLFGMTNEEKTGDKFGPANTSESWFSIDAKGKLNREVSYLGTFAGYHNTLDSGNTPKSQEYLRGNTDNKAMVLGLKYEKEKKFSIGTVWAQYMDHFRAVNVVNVMQNRGVPYHPLEDVLVALSLGADNPRTGLYEGLLPPNQTEAAPAATSINRTGDSRPAGFFLNEIHGFRDFQLNGQYYFRPFLSFRLVHDYLIPSRSCYNYRAVKVLTARLLYQICPKSHLELRAISATSKYGRTLKDVRTEFFMRF